MMFEGIESDEYDSDEFYEEVIGCKKCCAVELPDDFDPNKPPTTGEEYLQHVMYETQNYKAISTDTVLKKKVNEFPLLPEEPTYIVPESSLLPSREWNEQKLAEFIKFRKYIHSKLPPPHLRTAGDGMWMKKIDVEYPKFSVVSKLSLSTLANLSEALADRLDDIKRGHTIPDKVSVWIYTVLALLQVPLLASDIGSVRLIAKRCTELRAQLPADASAEMYNNLNFIICIIGLCFNQGDLISYAD
ncbi:hypothetical protein ILUMI_12973 [Ignelater luminosus]|uniref:Gem-associated protein 2 n=1 Tax=Ignelater luminosus TaxID=2038154 RepID=A0A8K0CXH7_IGNLU|nr:hypothetical protein ILUMI_12973 [Ignelater luminosus]